MNIIRCFTPMIALLAVAVQIPVAAGVEECATRQDTEIRTPVSPKSGATSEVFRDPAIGDRTVTVTSPANATKDPDILFGPIVVEPRVDLPRESDGE